MKQARFRTNYGVIVLEMFPEKAPSTVANFVRYVESGFYDNTLFHRVIAGFMIQGGGLERGMHLKTTDEPIQNEAANGLRNTQFSVAMARVPAPHSATAQFFINLGDNEFLNYSEPTDEGFGYCVFGRVIEGADVVTTVGDVKTGERSGYKDVPEQDVVVEAAEMVEEESGDSQ